MNRLRFRLLDLVLVTTFVSFVCGTFASGYYLNIGGFYIKPPSYLTGDFESYYTSNYVVAPGESWQPNPYRSMPGQFDFEFDKSEQGNRTGPFGNAYAIGKYQEVIRLDWTRIAYDAVLTLLAVLFVAAVTLQIRRRLRLGQLRRHQRV